MPTGYTAGIEKGMTFQEYALGCARAFGALVEMRDDPMGKPIPEKFEPSTYHIECLDRARTRLKFVESLTLKQAEVEAEREYQDALASHTKYATAKNELRKRYEVMLAEVRAYIPPSPDHVEYKQFMESQLSESIRFDCGYSVPAPKKKDPEQWLRDEQAKALKDIAYHREEYTKEQERTESRNRWVRQLRESLGITVAP
jgi:hypothetical protein